MGSFSLMHWMVVLVIAMLFFGAGRISDIGKGLGEGIRNFKKGLGSDDDQPENATKAAPPSLASNKKKVIQVEVADGEDEAEALKKAAAAKAAETKAASEKG
jgi:sec-independent protein translocase protein TatA